MSISRTKPIEDLYADVAEYDLVLVPDAPLASALNRRLDRPHLGEFATTPRRLAAGRKETAEDRLAFLELIDQTELSWKQAAYIVGNILQCWEYECSCDAILSYENYAAEATKLAVEHIRPLDTTSRQLTDFQVGTGRDVAVVGYDQFTPLEQSILPPDYDTISLFTETAFELPPVDVFQSAAGIVDAVTDAVSAETAENVGIVLDGKSEYSALVESALEAAEIPFYGGPGFIDEPDHRAFLQLLRTATGGSDIRVQAVRPLLTHIGFEIDVAHDEKRISELSTEGADWLRTFASGVGDASFEDLLSQFEQTANTDCSQLRAELDHLGIEDQTVTGERIEQLAFYLQTYEVPIDRHNEGVLLADAGAAAFVDRPVIFYLGLDDSWTQSAPQRPWVDEDALYTRNIQAFQLLLQNGVDQHYFVQDSRGGDPVTPCLYLEDLLDEMPDRFTDLEHTIHNRSLSHLGTGFEREPSDIDPETIDSISQSSLNTYVNCPRDYLFSRIVESPDKDYFTEGNLYHDFAEFYVNHPEVIDTDTIEELVDVMLSEAQPFHRTVQTDIKRTEYRLGLETIVEYLDTIEPTEGDLSLPCDTTSWGNYFAEYFDRDLPSPVTERWFDTESLGVKGKIDLIQSPTTLLDYKSSSRKRASQVVKGTQMDPPPETPNYQAIQYLTYLRTLQPETELEFSFLHFLEPLDDALTGTVDFDDALTTVTYYPKPFVEHARSEAMFEHLCTDGANNCQKTLGQASYTVYASVFDDHDLPDTRDSDELIDSPFGTALENRLQETVGEYKYVTSGCHQLLRELARIRSRNFFADDLDAFEDFIDRRLAELNQRRTGAERFPVDGLAGEPNYRRVNNRDLLLTDD